MLEGILEPDTRWAGAIDWQSIESSWGTLPQAGYVEFMDRFGPGSIEDYLSILMPIPDVDNASTGVMAQETHDARRDWSDPQARFQPPLVRGDQRLLCWGVSDDANRYCWDLHNDTSKIYVYHRLPDVWNVYNVTFVEFISGLVHGAIEGYLDESIASYDGWTLPVVYYGDSLV